MEEEVTQEEIERCYRLANMGIFCSNVVYQDNICERLNLERQDYESIYREFRKLAQAYDIVMPEQLPEEYNERNEAIQHLVASLTTHFENRNEHLQTAIQCGIIIGSLGFNIDMCNQQEAHDGDTKEYFANKVAMHALALQYMAEERGIDIREELQRITRRKTELQHNTEITRLKFDLKKKFCNLLTKETINSTKRSEVDPTRIINNQFWVISLVRLPDRGNNEHAFLVLEAKTEITSKIWFIDFVAAQETDLLLPGIRDGKVRIWSFPPEETARSSNKLLFQCPKRLMDVRENERLLYISWSISRTSAEVFLRNVEAKQNRPPKYNILGDTMLAGSSASSSSEDIGHNCFSFARKMLLDLNDPYIQIPADKLGDWIISATSRLLVDPEFERHKRQMSRFPMLFAFLAGLVVSYIIFRLLP